MVSIQPRVFTAKRSKPQVENSCQDEWSGLRHKVRVIILKQWKNPKTIYTNLNKISIKFQNYVNKEDMIKVVNSRLGCYKRCSMDVKNYILNTKIVNIKTKEKPDLIIL